jgi:mono/diheme cytochrome c family protein
MWIAPMILWVFVMVAVAGAQAQRGQTGQGQRGQAAQGQGGGGWTLPPEAQTDKNPVPVNPATMAFGQKLFAGKCERCHGKTGKGDGPDGEPEHMQDMDLTVAARAARNPDGVVFYKIWNGRGDPKMAPMKDELSKEQVWALVAYVQTLRGK